jgi:hypothetical protein
MTTTTVIDGQSLVDIAIQTYGSVAGLVDLALRNGKSVTGLLKVGEVLQVGEVLNKDVVQYFKERNLKVATGAEMINVIDFDEADFDYLDFN